MHNGPQNHSKLESVHIMGIVETTAAFILFFTRLPIAIPKPLLICCLRLIQKEEKKNLNVRPKPMNFTPEHNNSGNNWII